MQYMGFLYSIAPGLRDLDYASNMDMGNRFFNTQPYLAPTIEGIYLHLIEHGRYEDAERLIQPVSSSLAALGDSLFWAVLKPVACLLCLIAVFTDRIWAIIPILLAYNASHIWIMVWGFIEGYRNGPQGAFKVGRAISAERSGMLSLIIPFLCGVSIVLAPLHLNVDYLLAFPVMVISAIALYSKINFLIIFYGFFILMMIMTIIL